MSRRTSARWCAGPTACRQGSGSSPGDTWAWSRPSSQGGSGRSGPWPVPPRTCGSVAPGWTRACGRRRARCATGRSWGSTGRLPSTADEPAGAVELRVVSGPEAGTVRRLGPGTHRVGPDPTAALLLPDGAPTVDVEVDIDGGVTLVPVRGHDEVRPAPVGPSRSTGRSCSGSTRRPPIVAGARWPGQRRTVDPEADGRAVELGRARGERGHGRGRRGPQRRSGDSLVELWRPTPPDASLSASPAGATFDYNRPPRLLPAPG